MFFRMKYISWIMCIILLIPMVAQATLDIDSRLLISKTSRIPVIDGDLDIVWKNTSRTYMRQFVDNRIDHDKWRDQFAVFRAMYDENYIYLYVEILDEDTHANDGVEFFFDGDNDEGSTSYDSNDSHLRWLFNNTSEAFGNAPNSVAFWKNTTLGYNFEVKIPKSDLNMVLEEGREIGFDVGAFDNDDDNVKSHVRWWSDDIQSESNPSLFGTALLIGRTLSDSLDITPLSPAPVIDGSLDEVWNTAPEIGQSTYIDQYNETNLLTFVDWYDLQMSYRAGWDSNGLYLYVNVIDDAIRTTNVEKYKNDRVELFIDGLNEKTGTYDSNDFHRRWMYGDTFNDGDSEVVFVETDNGYVFEAFIANSELTFTPTENHVFGLELRVNDNDNVDREGAVQWFSNSFSTNTNPSLFGTAILSNQSLDHVTVDPDTFKFSYESGVEQVNLTYYGAGTVGWLAGVVEGESWIRIITDPTGSRSGEFVFEYDENTSHESRTGQIEVRRSGRVAKVVQVMQEGVPIISNNKVVVVHGGNTIGAGDQALVDHMEDVGIDITLVRDIDADVSDTTGMNAVLLLQSITSNYINDMFKGVKIPVIVSEPFIYNQMGLCVTSTITGNNAKDIAIVAPDDRLAFGFADTISVLTVDTGVLNLGNPGAEATIVATSPANGEAVIFYYNKGDHLVDNSIADALRVGFFINGQYGDKLTESGIRLFEAVLDWALPDFDLPKVKIVNPWVNDFAAGDKVLNPGEFVQLSFSIQNNRQEALGRVTGIPDKEFDVYLHPDTAYFFDDVLELNTMIASGATSTIDALDTYVASVIPPNHVITVPIKFYDQNNLPVGLDTLKFNIVGEDTRVPFFSSDTILITYPPTYLPIDSVVTMMSYVHEAGTVASAVASIKDKDEVEIGQILLYDDGTSGGDTLALDRVFTGQWTADTEGELDVTFVVEDQHGNVGADTNAVSFTVIPRRASEFNLVAPTGLPDTLTINNATIESMALEAGDQIGVFDDTLCVGSLHFGGTFPVSIQIWHENGIETPGAELNNLMLFKIYDASEDTLYRGFPIYEKGNGVFGEAITVVERLNSNLSSAFNLVDPTGRFQKLYVDSVTIGMSQLSVGDQLGIFDDTLCVGAAIFEGTYPIAVNLWLASGSALGAREGDPILYQILDESVPRILNAFPMYGVGDGLFGEDSLLVTHLASGFAADVIPVLPTGQYETVTINLATLVSEPIVAGDQIGVFDDTLCVGSLFFNGTYPVVIPVWDTQTIGGTKHLGAEIGQAIQYKIWDTSSASVNNAFPVYSLGMGNGVFGEDTTVVQRLNSQLNESLTQTPPTGLYYTVYVDMGYYKSDTLQTGDQVGVFDDTLCVGSSIYEGVSPLPVTIWLDNGDFGLGARDDYPMLYKVWDKTNTRLLSGYPVYAEGTGLFGEDSTFVRRLQTDLADSLQQVDPTGVFQTVYVNKAYYKSQAIHFGDEIGVFYDTLCVGAAIYENVDPLAITVWTENQNFIGGSKAHPARFKIWDADQSKLLPAFPVYSVGSGLFGEDSTMVSRLQSNLAEPFLQVQPTGKFETITVQDATIARNPLVTGDQIAVFADTVCIGATIYEGVYPVPVTVWYENTVGESKYQGATLGNAMSYKIWDSQYSQELVASALYSHGSGVFGEDTTAISRLITDAIALKLDIKPNVVNWTSFNLLPDSLEIVSLFRPLTTLSMVRNDVGEYYFPAQNLNTLENVEFEKGYRVFAELDTIQPLSYIGTALDPTAYTLNLTTNQNYWLGYPYRNSYKLENVYGGIRSKVLIMQNDEGEFWIPSYNINTMVNLMPGEAYEVSLSSNVDFTYADLTNTTIAAAKDTVAEPMQFEFTKTGLPYGVVITGIAESVEPGDEIAIFDGDLCVGAAIIPEAYPFVLAAWEGSDAFDLTGFRAGNNIQFQIWQASDSTKRVIAALFDNQPSSKFRGAAMSVARLENYTGIADHGGMPMEFALEQNYPNPFNPETNIRYQLPKKADVQLQIFNMLGQEVKKLVDQNKQAGYYTIKWDGTNHRGMAVESGLYFLRIKAGDYVKTRKMIMVK